MTAIHRIAPTALVAFIAIAASFSATNAQDYYYETVDEFGSVGAYCRVAVDGAGRPHLAYWYAGGDDLKYATRQDGVWLIETVDAGNGGDFCDIAVDANGVPHISYRDYPSKKLKYAVKSGGVWTLIYPGTANDAGLYTSIDIDPYGNPHMSHYASVAGDLLYVFKDGGLWNESTLESAGVVGLYSNIEIGPSGELSYGYWTSNNGGEILIKGGGIATAFPGRNAQWFALGRTRDVGLYGPRGVTVKAAAGELEYFDGQTLDTISPGFGVYTSAAISDPGIAHIAAVTANDGNLLYLAGTAGGGWLLTQVDEGTTSFNSVALDQHDNPMIAYYHQDTADLKFADWGINLTSALAGVTWPVGAERSIVWRGAGAVDIYLSVDGGATWTQVANNVRGVGSVASREFQFTVPHAPSKFCKVKIIRGFPYDESVTEALFTIEASIALLNLVARPAPEGAGNLVSWQTDPGPTDLAGYRLERGRSGANGDPEDWTTVVPLSSAMQYHDTNGQPGDNYRLFAINGLGQEYEMGEASAGDTPPTVVALNVWPVPFRSGDLNIVFATASGLGGARELATVSVYDIKGRLVREIASGVFNAGVHTATWDGRNTSGTLVPSGVYFVKSESGANIHSRKVVVAR